MNCVRSTALGFLLSLAALGGCSSSSAAHPGGAPEASDGGSLQDSGVVPDDAPRTGVDGSATPEASTAVDAGGCPEVDAGLPLPGCSSAGAVVTDGVACCSTTASDNGNGSLTCSCSDGPANQTGFSCNTSADCCSVPCYNFACCKPPQAACTGDGDCCSGTCTGGSCACSPKGAPCTVAADCCGCAACVAGQCSG